MLGRLIMLVTLLVASFINSENVQGAPWDDRDMERMALIGLASYDHDFVPNDKSLRYAYPAHSRMTIDSTKLGQCFAAAAASSGFPPSLNANSRTCISRTAHPTVAPSDVWPTNFDYLSGQYIPCDYSSGHETELRDWMLGQPDNSIDPFTLYERSLQLNRGNIYLAILTIHQLLRPYARWNQPYRYIFQGRHPTVGQASALLNKLIDIRGDLWEADEAKNHGDHGGTWYRVWGAMLFHLEHFSAETSEKAVEMGSCRDGFYNYGLKDWARQLLSKAIFYTDEKIGKGHNEPDARKYNIDRKGSESMDEMMRTLSDYRLRSQAKGRFALPSLDECRNQIYLLR